MQDFLVVFVTISIVTALIYILYKIMLNSSQNSDDAELQITSEDIFEQLSILQRQKKHNIVVLLAKKYLESKSGDDGVRLLYAKALFESKKIYEAIEQAKYLISRQPKNSEVRTFMAKCYSDVGKPMKAIICLQDILEYDSDNVYAIKELARLYYDTNQKLSAIKMYKRFDAFLDNNLEKAKNKAFIAFIHLEFNEFGEAIKEYEEILKIYPDDISVKKELVELYKLTADYDSAIATASEIFEVSEDSNKLWAMQQPMAVYTAMQDYEKALELASLIKEHPLANEIQIGEEIANVFRAEGNIEESIKLLKELIPKDADNIHLKKSLARAYETGHQYDAAVKVYREILDIASVLDIETIHYELSNLYANWALHSFLQDDSAESFRLFMIAIKYNSTNPDIYYKLGNVNKAIKNFNEAISQYKKAIELAPTRAEYYWEMAECYEEIDSPYEQKKMLGECLKYDPNNFLVYYKLGALMQLQNDTQGAVSSYKKAIELEPNFVETKKSLALLFEHLGRVDDAIELYSEILKLEPENEEIFKNLEMLKA